MSYWDNRRNKQNQESIEDIIVYKKFKKNKNKKYSVNTIKFLLMMIFLVILISSSINAEQINKNINLNVQCSNSTYSNITSVIYKTNSTYILKGEYAMTKSGTNYNYTLNSTLNNNAGTLEINYHCNVNGIDTTAGYLIDVTNSGFGLSTSQSILYILGLALAFIFFIISLYFSIVIPFRNTRGQVGNVIDINWYKYLKMILIAVSYMLLLLISGMAYNVTYNFLNLNAISSIFNWIYWIMLSSLYPLIVIIFIFMVIIGIQDNVLKKKLERGGFFR